MSTNTQPYLCLVRDLVGRLGGDDAVGGLAREAALVGQDAPAQPLHDRPQQGEPLLGRVPAQPQQEHVGHPVMEFSEVYLLSKILMKNRYYN